MTADGESRVKRRYAELLEKGNDITLEQVRNDRLWRDKNDSQREIAPAVPAKDSVLLDNSNLNCEETVEAALKIIRKTLG